MNVLPPEVAATLGADRFLHEIVGAVLVVAEPVSDVTAPSLSQEAYTRRDRDGLIFIDYLKYNAMSIENTPLLAELFPAIRNNIQNALDASRPKPRVLQEVAWLARCFNESLARWLSDPELAQQRSAFNKIEPIDLELM